MCRWGINHIQGGYFGCTYQVGMVILDYANTAHAWSSTKAKIAWDCVTKVMHVCICPTALIQWSVLEMMYYGKCTYITTTYVLEELSISFVFTASLCLRSGCTEDSCQSHKQKENIHLWKRKHLRLHTFHTCWCDNSHFWTNTYISFEREWKVVEHLDKA